MKRPAPLRLTKDVAGKYAKRGAAALAAKATYMIDNQTYTQRQLATMLDCSTRQIRDRIKLAEPPVTTDKLRRQKK